MERERKYMVIWNSIKNNHCETTKNIKRLFSLKATENALKVQISQLETTLKSDLNDKSRLTEALGREREAFAQMESDFQVELSGFETF